MFLKGSQASDRTTLQEINQMEREMCNYLDWELSTTQYWATSRPWSSGISFQVPRGRIRHTRSYGVEALDTSTHGYSNTTSLASSISPPPFLPKTFWIKISLGSILPNKVLSVHLGCPCEGWPCTLGHPPANACTLTISAPTSCRISPQPKITWISAAIQTVFRRFWPPAVERVHTDHVSPDVPPDQPPTKTTWISAFWPAAVERVHIDHVGPDVPPDRPLTKTTWISPPAAERMDADHIDVDPLPDPYPTQNHLDLD
ncbi:hypothetical protein MVEN_00146300 [Mycena venus]|uniref:Uncharacterized protein n=1 Tax=Mycena venus TaxID=2733690 RepID=A0A8H6Z0A2_9AGAR|nr:hypothetical protein MVEN_00146300 [Mycena venus]